MGRPTIVFCPGAWITISGYGAFLNAIRSRGWDVEATNYPSHDTKEPDASGLDSDATFLRTSLLEPLIDGKGKDVLLIAHSYGAQVGSAAAHSLSRPARARANKAGGVTGFLVFAGIIPNISLGGKDTLGGEAPWCLTDNPAPGLETPENPKKVFAADVDQKVAGPLLAAIKPHASKCFWSPLPAALHLEDDMNGRLRYIVHEQDQAIPAFLQQNMLEKSTATWDVQTIDSSHSGPFLQAQSNAVDLAEEFANLVANLA